MTNKTDELIKRKITDEDVIAGEALNWDIFSSGGSLLLSKGHVIKSDSQITQLIARGACYYCSPEEVTATKKTSRDPNEPAVSFLIINTLLDHLKNAFAILHEENDPTFINRIMRIALDIQYACDENTDAMVGSIQLNQEAPNFLAHPLHNAILCEAACRRQGKGPLDRLPILVAALTQNIGMLSIQEQVFHQEEALSEEQQTIIDEHPQTGHDLLVSHGVTEKRWLTAVRQHHERIDGSGYPAGISGADLSEDAKLLAITDNYTALIRPRAYRSRILHKDALRQMLQQRGSSIDGDLVTLLINAIGIYSPGSLIVLTSGETGIVTRLTKKLDEPQIRLISDARGHASEIGEETPTGGDTGLTIKNMLCAKENQHLLKGLRTVWPMQHPLARDEM
ncbi:HD-GYP domain-containing protein [Aliamphritea hakodatensis]|uniref:HD-GYP domain-containing protein n=1 Tax=Aliamphritea hakodatensis TaxID=2895352 RepID=UPI0022FD3CD8|nr:HD domain-containing phosphohydrolase [Aliamphritea hakodatensis]